MGQDVWRVAIVPLLVALSGFILEVLAAQVRGLQDGVRRFKLWLRRADGTLHADSPCHIGEVIKHARARSGDQLVHVSELASSELYEGFSFDLCVAALTTDIIALFNDQVPEGAPVALAIHLFLLVVVMILITANHRTPPIMPEDLGNQGQSKVERLTAWFRRWAPERRTIVAILVGLLALTTGLYMLWTVL